MRDPEQPDAPHVTRKSVRPTRVTPEQLDAVLRADPRVAEALRLLAEHAGETFDRAVGVVINPQPPISPTPENRARIMRAMNAHARGERDVAFLDDGTLGPAKRVTLPALKTPRSGPRPAKPRGRKPALTLERYAKDVARYPDHTVKQRAKRHGVSAATVRRRRQEYRARPEKKRASAG